MHKTRPHSAGFINRLNVMLLFVARFIACQTLKSVWLFVFRTAHFVATNILLVRLAHFPRLLLPFHSLYTCLYPSGRWWGWRWWDQVVSSFRTDASSVLGRRFGDHGSDWTQCKHRSLPTWAAWGVFGQDCSSGKQRMLGFISFNVARICHIWH